MAVAQGFPVPTTPIVSAQGSLTPVWYQFMYNIWNRTGGSSSNLLTLAAGATISGQIPIFNGTLWNPLTVTGDASLSNAGVLTVNKSNGNAFGTLAFQNANAVGITGGSINGTSIGATTPSSGNFSSLLSNGSVTFSNLSAAGVVHNSAAGLLSTSLIQTADFASSTGSGAVVLGTGATIGTPTINTPTISGGTVNNASVGATTPSTGAFTALSATGVISGVGFSNYLAAPPSIGGTTPAAGAFTTLSASSTVSGAGFSTYLASPPAIGATAAAAGSFTTLTATGLVGSASDGACPVKGTNTNDNAASGYVGEYISSTVAAGSAVALTNGVPANVTSISLTAGDWDVSGFIATNPAGTTTQSVYIGSISTTSATNTQGNGFYWVYTAGTTYATGNSWGQSISPIRLSLSATTTVYLVVQSNFGVSTNAAYGFIGARRSR